METKEVLDALETTLEEVQTGVLATVNDAGVPNMRWMTPRIISGREGYVYAVTSPKFGKVASLAKNNKVEWMIQSKGLDKIFNVRGTLQLIDNPSVKSGVLEEIGPHLQVFWRVNPDASDLVVLETVIEEIQYFNPMKADRLTVVLHTEADS